MTRKPGVFVFSWKPKQKENLSNLVLQEEQFITESEDWTKTTNCMIFVTLNVMDGEATECMLCNTVVAY